MASDRDLVDAIKSRRLRICLEGAYVQLLGDLALPAGVFIKGPGTLDLKTHNIRIIDIDGDVRLDNLRIKGQGSRGGYDKKDLVHTWIMDGLITVAGSNSTLAMERWAAIDKTLLLLLLLGLTTSSRAAAKLAC